MGVIAEGILRGCQGLFTPVSLDTHYQFSIKTLLSNPLDRLTSTWVVPLFLVRTWFVPLPVCDHSKGVYFPPNTGGGVRGFGF